MNSKEKLAQALENYKLSLKIGEVQNMPFYLIDEMISKAKMGYYSDYDSPLATPCIQLVEDLGKIKAHELIELAKNGEFDATIEESDEWYKREGRALVLEVTGGNEEIADALFGKVNKEEKEAKEGIKGWDY